MELLNFKDAIKSYRELEYDWDGYGASPIQPETLINVQWLYDLLPEKYQQMIDSDTMCPNPHGTISIEFHVGEISRLSLEIGNKELAYYFRVNRGLTHTYDNLEIPDQLVAENLVKNLNKVFAYLEPVKIIKVTPERVRLYNPQGTIVGDLNNDQEFNQVRIQIAEQELEGYYVMWKEHLIDIASSGDLKTWPYGLYDHTSRDMAKLYQIGREKATELCRKYCAEAVGKTKEEAEALAKSMKVTWRMRMQDGQPYIGTADHRPDRANLVVENGVVVSATKG